MRYRVPGQVPEVVHEHDDASIHSLNSQGSINHPSYAEQQKQAEDAARKTEAETKRVAKQTESKAKEFGQKADSKAAELERDGKKAFNDVSSDASKDYDKVKKQAQAEGRKAEKAAKDAGTWADDNKQNPVVIGNAVVVAALAGLIGVGAYRKYVNNELTPKVVGIWAGAVGLFAVGDYYVSS